MSLRRIAQIALVVVVASMALAFGSAAGAVDNPDYTAPPPSSVVDNSVPKSARQISAAATPSRQRLAITGADSLGLLVVGSLLVAGGAATLVLRRRNTLA